MQHRLLVGEVVVERAGRQVGLAHDVANGRRAVADLREDPARRLEDRGAVRGLGLLALAREPRSSAATLARKLTRCVNLHVPWRAMRAPTVPLGAAVLACALAGPAAAKDYSSTARNIIPSGQYGGVPTPKADVQAKMYDALTPLFDKVTNADLNKDFKSEKLGKAGTPGPDDRREGAAQGRAHRARQVQRPPRLRQDPRRRRLGVRLDPRRRTAGCCSPQGRYPVALRRARRPGHQLDQPDRRPQAGQDRPRRPTRSSSPSQTALLKQRRARRARALLHDIDMYVKGINARLKFEKSTADAVHARGHLRVQRGRRPALRPRRRRRGAALASCSAG